MNALVQRLKERYFRDDHPYRFFEREVEQYLRPDHTLLDAGCGRTAPVLAKYRHRARRLIGVDLVDFAQTGGDLELYRCDLGAMPLADRSIDVTMSRSVMEHVTDPLHVYNEIYRVLKPGGRFIFLTANLWDYASLAAKLVPNRFHPWVVSKTEGRDEQDVFPVAYRTNTRGAVSKWSKQAGFEITGFRYLGQYPSYFMFNAGLFLIATGYEKLISRISFLNALQGWILVTLTKPAQERNDA
jgi:ubiquinone/menaquinone biosynthesis C-methylase UbiE